MVVHKDRKHYYRVFLLHLGAKLGLTHMFTP